MGTKRTREEFIEKAKEVHGGKYFYDKVNYVNSGTKVAIICPKHGEFKQTPHSHLKGHGCKKCGTDKITYTDHEFIEKAKEVHGNKYSYDKVNYFNNNKKVIIICPKHGEFKQVPRGHLRGNGCKKCETDKITYTDHEFIEKAKEVHGGKYSYDKVNYVNSGTKVIITCLKHGEFEQTPGNHLQGKGCEKCKIDNQTYTNHEFIEKAKEVHGGKYSYDKVDYKLSEIKVVIICPKHGKFEQTPHSHLKGHGCQKCEIDNQTYTNHEFIEKAKEVHGNKYSYDKVDYKHSNTKVIIICPKHGEFEQIPHGHLKGYGCRKCSESKGEKAIRNYFEENGIIYESQKIFKKSKINLYKFDFAVRNLKFTGLIEYNGIQHYTFCSFGSNKNNAKIGNLVEYVRRDHKKYQWCKEHKIPLLVIPFWDFDRIKEILDDLFNGRSPKISIPPYKIKKYKAVREKIIDKYSLYNETKSDLILGLQI